MNFPEFVSCHTLSFHVPDHISLMPSHPAKRSWKMTILVGNVSFLVGSRCYGNWCLHLLSPILQTTISSSFFSSFFSSLLSSSSSSSSSTTTYGCSLSSLSSSSSSTTTSSSLHDIGKLLNSCTGKVDSEPAHGSIVDIPHIHACKQTLGLSADELHQMASAENNTSGLVPQGQKASDYDNSDPVPPRQGIVPSAEKTDSSQQGLEFLFSPLLEEYYNPNTDQAWKTYNGSSTECSSRS
ncbi:hypothetical protein Tco_0630038 [Tanacetum coccineum]